jgi:hypothetical protein
MISNEHLLSYSQTGVNKMTGECTSCHNPHLTWNKENPNLLKDHLVYKHKVADNLPKIYDTANKGDRCENCHTETARELKELKDINGNPIVTYSALHYRNSSITKGTTEDNDLCLSCHDGSNVNIPNIKEYFQDTSSKHRITAQDGSRLTSTDSGIPNGGHISCSECHDTHGSKNIKVLKEKLGHEDRQASFTASATDKDSSGVLIGTKEREFCIKCHNGSTAIFGVTGNALDTTKSDGHLNTNSSACSSCHGGTTGTDVEKALRAAHAPTAGTP